MSWSSDIRKASKLLDIALNDMVRLIAFHIYAGVIQKTPVDEGHLRSAWNMTLNRPEFKTQPGDTGSAQIPDSGSMGRFPQIHITNGLPYAAVVEYGLYPGIGPKTVAGANPDTGSGIFSRRAPQGMLQLTMLEVQMNLAGLVRNV